MRMGEPIPPSLGSNRLAALPCGCTLELLPLDGTDRPMVPVVVGSPSCSEFVARQHRIADFEGEGA